MKRTPYILIGALLLLILFVFVAVLIRIAQPPPPSLAYSAATYLPGKAVYLAGETMIFTPTITVQHPGIVDARRGWRTFPWDDRARLCDGTPAKIITSEPPPFPPSAVGKKIVLAISVPVPDLPTGDYKLVSTSFNKQGGETTLTVRVRVVGSC